MKKLLIIFLTLLCPLSMCAEDYSLFLNSGHTDAVLCMAVDEARSLIYTGGKDGMVRVWSAGSFSLIRKMQISNLPIRKIDFDPRGSHIAIVESDGGSLNFLSVWDWEKSHSQFRIEIPEVPLVLSYSPQGNFISVSKTDWQSLSFFDTGSGKRLNYLRDGFGIVSFLYISSSENTLISYTPSTGSFTYWNLKSSTVKGTVRSIPELKNLASYSERYAIGALASELVVIDLVTGSVSARTSLSGIQKIIVDRKGDIGVLFKENGSAFASIYRFSPILGMSGGTLTAVDPPAKVLPLETADIAFGPNRLLAAYPNGTVASFESGSYLPQIYGENLIEPVTDLIFTDKALYLSTKEKIFTFQSDFFTENGSWQKTLNFSASSVDNPLRSPAGLLASRSGNVFLWKKGMDTPGVILDFDTTTGLVFRKYEDFTLPLVSVQEFEDSLYAIESNGYLRKLDTNTFLPSFRYPAAGLQTLAPLKPDTLIAGRSVTGAYGSPLVSINTLTGETVPIEKEALAIVYSIKIDRNKNIVYFLGLRNTAGDKTETALYSGNAAQLEKSEILTSIPYADIYADMYVDSESSHVFTTVGNGGVRTWNGSRWKMFESNNNQPGMLREQGGYLYAVNEEGSVSVWEKASGKHLAELYILKNNSWLIITSNGYYLSQNSGLNPELSLYHNGTKMQESSLEKRRIVFEDN